MAALAYGTETVPAVDKITGPGNAYVAAAKRQVFGKVGVVQPFFSYHLSTLTQSSPELDALGADGPFCR